MSSRLTGMLLWSEEGAGKTPAVPVRNLFAGEKPPYTRQNMSRILLATIGSLGDLHPLISIGLELGRRGHVVRFCTSETYRPKLEALGFGFDPLRPDVTPENEAVGHKVREIMDPRRGAERLLRGVILPELKATYQDLLRAVMGPPKVDFLVAGELIYPAPIIAEKFEIPWASCTTAPMSFFSGHELPVLPPVPRLSRVMRRLGPSVGKRLVGLVKWTALRWSDPIRGLRSELGLPPGEDPIFEGKFSRQLVLAIFSSALAKPQPDWPTNTVVTGFPFYDGAAEGSLLPDELAAFLKAGEPPVVFTLGSSAVLDPGTFYQESARAIGLLNRRGILLMGRNAPPADLPPNVVAFGYAPFSQLFLHAAAVVHQGGVGTTGQVMRAGRPMLVMPYNFDQPDNGDRITRLGLGGTIARRDYKAPRVARRLQQLLGTPTFAQRAGEIASLVRKETGDVTAADAIEKLIR